MVVAVWAFPWLAMAVILRNAKKFDLSGLAIIQLAATAMILLF